MLAIGMPRFAPSAEDAPICNRRGSDMKQPQARHDPHKTHLRTKHARRWTAHPRRASLAARYEEGSARYGCVAEGCRAQYNAAEVVRPSGRALGGVSAALQAGVAREARDMVIHSC